jgi:hypothetical protein
MEYNESMGQSRKGHSEGSEKGVHKSRHKMKGHAGDFEYGRDTTPNEKIVRPHEHAPTKNMAYLGHFNKKEFINAGHNTTKVKDGVAAKAAGGKKPY